MKPIEKTNRGRVQLNHENRIQTLERRIPVDYPIWYGLLLDNTGNLTGPTTHTFSFTFPDDCPDPTGLECEDTFTTDGNYLLFPTGWGGSPFWITMVVAMLGGGGNIHNMYTMVTPGTVGETNEVDPYALVEVWRDNAPFGSISGQSYVSRSQTPPPANATLADRTFSWLALISGTGILDPATDRFAVKFNVDIENGAGPSSFEGVANVGLMPPNTGALPLASF